MGTLLSQLEEQNGKFEKRLWTIERQVAFLSKMFAEMKDNKNMQDPSCHDVVEKQPPQLTFDELVQKYGFLHRDSQDGIGYEVIPTYSVRKWLRINGYVE